MAVNHRPGRPLGLSIAIFLSLLLFSVIPLTQVGMVLIVQTRLQNMSSLAIPDGQGDTAEAIASGGNFTGIPAETILLQVGLASLFLVVSVLAWRGRPPVMRWAYTGAVIVYSLLTIISGLAPLFAIPNPQQGIDSGMEIQRPLLIIQTMATLLVFLYIIWYVNRAPARAFFRGYYLSRPEAKTDVGS